VRVVGGQDSVAATSSGERIEPLAARRAPAIVVSRVPRPAAMQKSPPSPDRFRGRIIDILV
jgi:hypothetical protein